jgi:hypothetical protein
LFDSKDKTLTSDKIAASKIIEKKLENLEINFENKHQFNPFF